MRIGKPDRQLSPCQSSSFSQAPGVTTREAVEDQFAQRDIPLIARHDPRRIARDRQLDQMVVGLVPEVRAPEIRDVDPLAGAENGIQQCRPGHLGPIGAVANNCSLDRTSSYSRNNALPISGRAAAGQASPQDFPRRAIR